MGSGGGASSGAKNAAQTQAKIVRDLFSSTQKGRQLGLEQNLNMLRTGGYGSELTPVLQNIVNGANSGTDTTIAQTQDASNKAGIDPRYTAGLANDVRTQGGIISNTARDRYALEAIGKSSDLAVAPVQLATQGLTGLVRRGAAADIAKGQADAQAGIAAGAAAGSVAAASATYWLPALLALL
jgi:hypothetical protein